MSALAGEFVINDHQNGQVIDKEGQGFRGGLVERDLGKHPVGSSSSSRSFSEEMELIPREEWPERCAEQKAKKSSLSHIRETGNNGKRIPSMDQNGQGFCWAYSTGFAIQLLRAKAGLPYVELSPHAVGCKMFNHQDRGAWGALSFDFATENGFPSTDFWPAKSMKRKYDTNATWEDAKKNRIVEGWIDLDINHASDANLTFDQMATCLLNLFPVVTDFYWWMHSVCQESLLDAKPELKQQGLYDPDRWCPKGSNSWTDKWGKNGTFVLQGKKAIPNGGCSPRSVTVG